MLQRPISFLIRNKTIFILLILFFTLRLFSFSTPIDRDEGEYAYFGWLWLSGRGIPYVSVINMKPPLLHFIYGIFSILFGNTSYAIRLGSILYTGCTIVLFYLFLKENFSKTTAIIGSILVIFFFNDYYIESSWFNAEMLILLPLTAAIRLLPKVLHTKYPRPQSLLLVGAYVGAAMMIKQVAIFNYLLFSILLALHFRSIRTILLFTVGFIIPTALFSGYFILSGTFGAFLYNIYIIAGESTKHGLSSDILCKGLSSNLECISIWMLKLYPTLYLPTAIAITGYFLTLKWKKHYRPIIFVGIASFLAGWLAIKGAGWKDWRHYYILLIPGIILGYALLIEYILKNKHHLLFLPLAFMFATPLLVQWTFFATDSKTILYTNLNFLDAKRASSWIDHNVPRSDELLVWDDEPEIYFYTRRKSPSPYEYYYLFEIPAFRNNKEDWWKWLNTTKPAWIVVSEGWNWDGTLKMQKEFFKIHKEYRLSASVGVFRIYKKTAL